MRSHANREVVCRRHVSAIDWSSVQGVFTGSKECINCLLTDHSGFVGEYKT